MKCPKCAYLGFETGDRCKNCGYDFSLLAAPAAPDPDLSIRTGADEAEARPPEIWLDRLDRSLEEATRLRTPDHLEGVPEAPSATTALPEAALPLFNPDDPDDIPLIALPAAPRAPLAVRRTPDPPRLRAVPRVARRVERASPALDFHDDLHDDVADHVEDDVVDRPPAAVAPPKPSVRRADERQVGGRRALAALIDHGILLAVDGAVVYFTLRMAGIAPGDVGLLPAGPMLTFMTLHKLAYFTAFTAVGGQTIGKMAAGIRVVSDGGPMDSRRAIQRTLAGLLSLLPLGLGFLPAFVGADRRAFHDRLTQTRVVGLPSA